MDLKMEVDGGKHDLVFVNGDCPVTDGRVDSVRQRLYVRLRTFLSEWYLNDSYGVPWLEKVLGHKGNKTTVDMVIQKEILDVKGVAKILEFKSEFDRGKRGYSCRFVVRTDSGDVTDEIII